eukprot:jgi/Bigna1/83283/fgenesh1_pg.105_\
MEGAVSLQCCIRALDYPRFQIVLLRSLQRRQKVNDEKQQDVFSHLDGKDGKGMTPLTIAASHSNNIAIRFVLRLLNAGANPEIPCSKGLKPLDHAVQSNSLLVKDAIEKHRARIVAFRRTIRRDLHDLHMLHPALANAVSRCSIEPLTPKALSLWVQGTPRRSLPQKAKILCTAFNTMMEKSSQKRQNSLLIHFSSQNFLRKIGKKLTTKLFYCTCARASLIFGHIHPTLIPISISYSVKQKLEVEFTPKLILTLKINANESCNVNESENELVKALHPESGNLLEHIRMLFGRDKTPSSLQRYLKKRVLNMNMRISHASQAVVAELRCKRSSDLSSSSSKANNFDEIWIEKMKLAFETAQEQNRWKKQWAMQAKA